jgi:hypothetical protein
MRTYQEFMSLCEEVEDKSKRLGFAATIKTAQAGGRIRPERKKTTPERRRMKAVGGGKMEPVQYKPRKDIGQQRAASTREQQPTQERGSADVKARAAAAAKEERKKAALARIAAKKAGQKPEASKPSQAEVKKTASKLLSTKKPAASTPTAEKKPKPAPSGLTRAERDKKRNAELRAKYNAEKQKALAGYKEVHGKPPTGKERTKLLAAVQKAHPPR